MEPLSWGEIILRIFLQFGPVWITLTLLFVVSTLFKRRLGLYGKLFDRPIGMIGYALVMEATQAIHIHDAIRNPT